MERTAFSRRFREAYVDPDFRAEDQSISRLEEIAWQIYLVGRKSPFTRKAGPACELGRGHDPNSMRSIAGWFRGRE